MHGPIIVDAIIIAFLFAYVAVNIRKGFFALIEHLLGFFGGVTIAFLTYHKLTAFVLTYWSISSGLIDAGVFLLIFALSQFLIHKILEGVFNRMPWTVKDSKVFKFLAILPAFIDGLLVASLILLILVVAPVLPFVKGPIQDSIIGSTLVDKVSSVENYVDKVFGKAAEESLGFLTVEPKEGESVSLPYKPKSTSIDANAEAQMLKLVNEERTKVGARALIIDPKIVEVARAHSLDMWQRQYFAHENPDGLTPGDRMRLGGVKFLTVGENLALARNVERAHEGLMNSPGHKRNILDPSFRRVGIGVIDGGVYGEMFTQNFAD